MDDELRLYQQVHAKLKNRSREVQVRTLEWVAKKLYEEHQAGQIEPAAPPAE